jgi:hypothetical protein
LSEHSKNVEKQITNIKKFITNTIKKLLLSRIHKKGQTNIKEGKNPKEKRTKNLNSSQIDL